jgi:hypothetical protein
MFTEQLDKLVNLNKSWVAERQKRLEKREHSAFQSNNKILKNTKCSTEDRQYSTNELL